MIKITYLKDYYKPLTISDKSVKIAFNYIPIYNENGTKSNVGTWCEHIFKNKPSFNQIKDYILQTLNDEIDDLIISGFMWKDMPVWLSTENQFNYKAAYDLAVQTKGKSLPITFKFGSSSNPQYYTFNSLEELTDFYTKVINHVNECLKEGWKKKDSINWEDYKIN